MAAKNARNQDHACLMAPAGFQSRSSTGGPLEPQVPGPLPQMSDDGTSSSPGASRSVPHATEPVGAGYSAN